MTETSNLSYRPCAGIMLLNQDGFIWLGRRIANNNDTEQSMYWQMPQGGIDADETPKAAAIRELEEETGITHVEIIAEAPDWLTYDLPEDLLGVALKGQYRGQKQKWFLMRFLGQEDEINISAKQGHDAEFDAWQWAHPSQIAELTVPFKQHIYNKLLEIFSPHCDN
ncbi:MAG: RNA pyrophosphohydrolase [Pseudomonadota bacterium]